MEMRGSFKAHPERRDQRADEPVGLPELRQDAPEWLSQPVKDAWKYLRAKLIPRVALEPDEPAFINLCEFWSRFVVNALPAPERKQMDTLLGKFGMNPSERSKVSAGPKQKANKFAAIG